MRVSEVSCQSQRRAKGFWFVALWGIRIGVVVGLLLPAGCSRSVKPGVTYNAWILTRGSDGKAALQGTATQVLSAVVENAQEISHGGQTLSLVVRKTQYGKATFDIFFPDKTTQRVQVKATEPKDVLPPGQQIGVRIEVLDSH